MLQWLRQHRSDQQLKVYGIHRLIIIGLIANTCLEATARFAAELGYDATVVKDATAARSQEEMHVALDVNLPNYVNAIVTTSEIVEAIRAKVQLILGPAQAAGPTSSTVTSSRSCAGGELGDQPGP